MYNFTRSINIYTSHMPAKEDSATRQMPTIERNMKKRWRAGHSKCIFFLGLVSKNTKPNRGGGIKCPHKTLFFGAQLIELTIDLGSSQWRGTLLLLSIHLPIPLTTRWCFHSCTAGTKFINAVLTANVIWCQWFCVLNLMKLLFPPRTLSVLYSPQFIKAFRSVAAAIEIWTICLQRCNTFLIDDTVKTRVLRAMLN